MAHVEEHSGTRRDFLFVATGAAGGIATAAAVWPLINQMNPSADVQALASIQVDVSAVEVGSQLTIKFLGKPVFIRRRTPEEIERRARGRDRRSCPTRWRATPTFPPTPPPPTQNRAMDEAGEWLVMIGVCTHLGCVPIGEAGDFGGWFCPCHGSHLRHRRPHPQRPGAGEPAHPAARASSPTASSSSAEGVRT